VLQISCPSASSFLACFMRVFSIGRSSLTFDKLKIGSFGLKRQRNLPSGVKIISDISLFNYSFSFSLDKILFSAYYSIFFIFKN